jgi:hypothetical protein
MGILGVIGFFSSHAEHTDPPKPPRVADGRCASNADCTGDMVCVTRSNGDHCEKPEAVPELTTGSPPSSAVDPHAALCPQAAKRAIDKLAACGFETSEIDEASLCSHHTYNELNFMVSRSCGEMAAISGRP